MIIEFQYLNNLFSRKISLSVDLFHVFEEFFDHFIFSNKYNMRRDEINIKSVYVSSFLKTKTCPA